MMWKAISKMFGMLLFTTFLLGSINSAMADGMIIPEPSSSVSIELLEYPDIRYHIVNVDINNQYVITTVDQEFYNPYDWDMVGTYIFPVPEGAVVSNFKIIIDGVEKTAEVLDADEARKLFEESVINMNDSSILQYIDNNLYSCDVVIPAYSSIKMQLRYEEILTMNNGMYKYLYTLSTEQFSPVNIETVSVTVNIKNDKNVTVVYCPSHDIITEVISEKEVKVKYQENLSRPNKDFELYFSVADKDFGASFLTFEGDKENFFMLFFNSNINEEQVEDYINKDIVFVIDESGSMSWDGKILQAKDALKWILEKLNEGDRFNIINFDYNSSWFSESLVEVNSESIKEAIEYAEKINAGGGTNINEALLTACDLFNLESDSTKIIFFLTDGEATVGITDTESITTNVKNANSEIDASMFVFGVGYDVNTHLLDRLAKENHGQRVYIDPDESINEKLTELFNKIQNPLLTDVTVEYNGITVSEIFPNSLPDLYSGSELVIVGKYEINDGLIFTTGLIDITVKGMQGSSVVEYLYSFNIEDNHKSGFIPRIWATRKIGQLMDEIKLEGETDELINQVKTLGIKYGIVTPYTSYLIQEQRNGVTKDMSLSIQDNDNDGVADGMQYKGKAANRQSEANQFYATAPTALATEGENIIGYGETVYADINGTKIDVDFAYDWDETTVTEQNNNMKEWVSKNHPDCIMVKFGSDDYFDLLDQEGFAEKLSQGKELLFEQNGQEYYVYEGELDISSDPDPLPEDKDDDIKKTKSKYLPGLILIIALVGIVIMVLLIKKYH